MSNQYVRIPNPNDRHHNQDDDEVEAAFDYREEDEDDHDDNSESRPLNPNASRSSHAPTNNIPLAQPVPSHQQSTYNFDSVDYDFPPPGSPPPPSATAFPNEIGNSNGHVPDFDIQIRIPANRPWWKRTAQAVLPQAVSDRLGMGRSGRPVGAVGSGINNDGVFANVTAKPTAPVRVQQGDETYIVPEDVQNEAPPSYASAQADAVPPYWETTVHAPFSPDSAGELIVDSLPTGSLFSFCWNMLVSISFNFVGFLLTYLLHTSHAARLGSRAGLGVTLIQYGFALRARLDNQDDTSVQDSWSGFKDPQTDVAIPAPAPTPATLAPGGVEMISPTVGGDSGIMGDATTEWISFFMMTMGWFILLTSLLGFYRVKRWERGILASQQATQAPRETPAPEQTPGTTVTFIAPLEQSFSLHGMSRIELLRQGLGMQRRSADGDEASTPLTDRALSQAETGQHPTVHVRGQDVIIAPPLDPNDPRAPEVLRAMEQEASMRNSLRSAGFL